MKCEICGAEMDEQLTRCIDADGNAEVAWVCPATPDQHEIAALRLERDELKQELEDMGKTMERMRGLLTDTANAIKGEPEPLKLHSWHDLPKLALDLEASTHNAWAERNDAIRERDAAQARVKEMEAILRAEGEEDDKLLVRAIQLRQRAEALAQERGEMVVALREALNTLCYERSGRWFIGFHGDTDVSEEVESALTSTADAAAKVRREILEEAMQRVIKLGALSQQTPEGVLAAILGAGEGEP